MNTTRGYVAVADGAVKAAVLAVNAGMSPVAV
jgi:hypothetical protein